MLQTAENDHLTHKQACITEEVHTVPREYGYDNIRCLLIICVVLGHLLEICQPFPGSGFLYRVIYSFHMPAFLFLFGYFARYDSKRILFSGVIPYAIFQTAYILFDRMVFDSDLVLQYTTPYWLLWYLLTCIFYQLLIPLYDTHSPRKQLLSLGIVLALALLAGYDSTVGYYVTLSRFFVFQPWFVLGLYYRKFVSGKSSIVRITEKISVKIFIIIAVCICLVGLYFFDISGTMLYGSYPYSKLGYSAGIRAFSVWMAFSWIAFLVCVLKPLVERKIPVFTAIGQNTLPVFLLHGFIVKGIPRYVPQVVSTPWRVLLSAGVIVLVFGNPFIGKCFKCLFSGHWIKRSMP